jgi:Fic family protein
MLSPLPPSPVKLASLDVRQVWETLTEAHRNLAELKGICESLPNQSILIDTLSIQEAKDSSEIENIITTHDEIYAVRDEFAGTAAVKEVRHYVVALRTGFESVRATGLIRLDTLLSVQKAIEPNRSGLRKLPGTVLKNPATGEIVYEPPQSAAGVEQLMGNLIDFIHAEDGLDPLLRMAIAHHQFESIHPFYDGNGRTGRILNLLMLQKDGLLDLPVLYLSRYITTTKNQYYMLLQSTREHGDWLAWCLYVVKGIAVTARSEIRVIKELRDLMFQTKRSLRQKLPKIYSQDLLNNLFRHPYTKIEFVESELRVSRVTAAKYLNQLVTEGFLEKIKLGKTNFYINRPLFRLLSGVTL